MVSDAVVAMQQSQRYSHHIYTTARLVASQQATAPTVTVRASRRHATPHHRTASFTAYHATPAATTPHPHRTHTQPAPHPPHNAKQRHTVCAAPYTKPWHTTAAPRHATPATPQNQQRGRFKVCVVFLHAPAELTHAALAPIVPLAMPLVGWYTAHTSRMHPRTIRVLYSQCSLVPSN